MAQTVGCYFARLLNRMNLDTQSFLCWSNGFLPGGSRHGHLVESNKPYTCSLSVKNTRRPKNCMNLGNQGYVVKLKFIGQLNGIKRRKKHRKEAIQAKSLVLCMTVLGGNTISQFFNIDFETESYSGEIAVPRYKGAERCWRKELFFSCLFRLPTGLQAPGRRFSRFLRQ